jgi:hypothetical protein
MKRASLVLLVAFMLTSSGLMAQDKPSFAGTWKLTSEAAEMTAPQMTVTQDAKTMVVTASTPMGEIKTNYNLDGTEARSPIEFNGQSIDRVTKIAWDGAKLKMTVKSEFNGQTFETKATWALNTDGTLLVETTRPDFQGGGAPVTSKATYKKG